MRQLINGRGRKPVTRVQTADETRREQHRAIAMNGWVAQICRDGVSTVLRLNAFEIARHLVERFIPADALPAARRAADRLLQPVFIEMNVLQGDAFWANESAAEGIVFVAADAKAIAVTRDLDPADGF